MDVFNNSFPSTRISGGGNISSQSIPRPIRNRRTYLPTMADAVDRLLRMDEVNPSEKRAVDRAIAAVQTAIETFAAHSSGGFKYYQSRNTISLKGIYQIADIVDVVSNVCTPRITPAPWPEVMEYRWFRIPTRYSYPVISADATSFTVSGDIKDGEYSNSSLEQLMAPLPQNFRRRGSVTDSDQYYPIIDVPAGVLQSWQDYWDWARSSASPRIFGSITADDRFQGELMFMLWPPYPDDKLLKMYYERYPSKCINHRVGQGTVSSTGTAIVSSVATFTEDHVASIITFSKSSTDEEIRESLSSNDLVGGQRVITSVIDSFNAMIDAPIALAEANVTYYLSDVIDAMPGTMTDALFRLCEYEMIRQSRGPSGQVATRFNEFKSQLELAMADDARYMDHVDDGPYLRDFYGYGVGNVNGRPGG